MRAAGGGVSDSQGNVVWLAGAESETHGVSIDEVLSAAKEECEEVVVLGYLKGTPEHLFARATFGASSAERSVWLMERVKAWLLNGCPAFED